MLPEKEISNLLDEINYATQKAEIVAQELREAKSLFAFGLDIKRFNAIIKALSYSMLSDIESREELRRLAKKHKDRDVLELIKEFEDD